MVIQRTLFLLKLFVVLRSLSFIMPIFTIYYELQKTVGIDGFFMSEAAFGTGILLSTVPAGWLSDVWQRKYVLAIGALLAAAGFLLNLVGSGFLILIFGRFIVGVGFAMISSSVSAMAYDTLLDVGMEEEHLKLQSHMYLSSSLSGAFAALCGGWLYNFHPDLPIAMTVVSCLAASGIAFLIPEPQRYKVVGKMHPIKDMIETTKYALHGHKEVACLILLSVMLIVATKEAFWIHQPFYQAVGVPVTYFGFLAAAGLGVNSLSAILSYKIEPKLKPKVTVLFLILFPVFIYGLSGFIASQAALILLVFGGAVVGFGKPVIEHAINKRIPSQRRATINSANLFLMNVIFITTLPFMGQLVDSKGPFISMQVIAVVLLLFGGITYLCLKRTKVI